MVFIAESIQKLEMTKKRTEEGLGIVFYPIYLCIFDSENLSTHNSIVVRGIVTFFILCWKGGESESARVGQCVWERGRVREWLVTAWVGNAIYTRVARCRSVTRFTLGDYVKKCEERRPLWRRKEKSIYAPMCSITKTWCFLKIKACKPVLITSKYNYEPENEHYRSTLS